MLLQAQNEIGVTEWVKSGYCSNNCYVVDIPKSNEAETSTANAPTSKSLDGKTKESSNKAKTQGKKELVVAVFDNDINKVREIVNKGINVDFMVVSIGDENVKGIKVHIKRIDAVLVIVEKGQGRYGYTPLHRSIIFGYIDIVRILLEGGADKNLKDGYGRTPLHLATRKNNLDCVRVLLDYNVSLDERISEKSSTTGETELGDTALITAAMYGYIDIVELLLNKGANVNGIGRHGLTPLIVASITCKFSIVEILIKNNADIYIQSDNGSTAMSSAEEHGFDDIAMLLQNTSNQNPNTYVLAEILMDALKAENHKKALEIVKNVNSVNYIDNNKASLLFIAAAKGYFEVCKILINKGAKLNLQAENGGTALMLASQQAHLEIVKLLIKKGAKLDVQGINGWTALMEASYQKNTNIVKILIVNGAKLDVQDNQSRTALIQAARDGYTEIVKLLLDKGAKVNLQDNGGWTALIHAARDGYTEIVKLLLDKGAKVNLQDNYGWTALMDASRQSEKEVVKLMLERGANTKLMTNEGRTAFDITANSKIKTLLSKYMKEKSSKFSHSKS